MQKTEMNILLVEDNPGDARIVTEILNESDLAFKLTHASLLEEALKFLNNERFDIALLDIELPDSSGLFGLGKLLANGPGMPVVLLTGLDDEDLGMAAVQKGAADYMVKGQIKLQNLIRTMRYAIERRRGQHEREITIEFLRLVNECTGLQELIRNAAVFFQRHSDCQAVGIRLREGDDYPYFEARGFPEEFVKLENSLCRRDAFNDLVKDFKGDPLFECMCGNVICGRIDPSKPFFTSHGSFWTNSTTLLLASTSEADRQAETRNRCNGSGYESVALLPLKAGKEKLGLLQLNDKRKGVFSPELVSLWERLADHLAVAIAKFRAEEALKIAYDNTLNEKNRLSAVMETLPVGLAIVDSQGGNTMSNRMYESLWGENRPHANNIDDYASYKAWWVDTGKPVQPEEWASARAVKNGETVVGQLMKIESFDGEEKIILNSASPIKGADGKITGSAVAILDISNLKRAEQALRDNEERYRSLVEMSPEAIFVNTESKITYANQAALRLFGASFPEEFLGKSPYDLYIPEYHPVMRDRIKHLMEGVSVPLVETKALRLDGSTIDIEVVASPFFEKGVRSIQVLVRDITERKRMEDIQVFLAQTCSEPNDEPFFDALARYLAQSLQIEFVCIDSLDRDGLTAHTLSVWYEGHFEDNVSYALKDTPCGELAGKNICCFPAGVRQFFPHDKVLHDLRAESYVGVTLWSHDGRPIGLIALIGHKPLADRERSIAEATLKLVAIRAAGELERWKAEKELKEQEEILRLFVKHSPAAVAMFDHDMRYLVHSDRWLSDYGLPQESLVGRSHYEVFPEIDETWKAVHRRCLAGTTEKNEDDHFIRKNGKMEWLRWEILPWLTGEGQIGGIIIFSEVITERKKMQEIVERYHLISRYARDPLLLVDLDGNIIEGNEAAVEFYGYTHDELLKLNIMKLRRQEDIETVKKQIMQARQEGVLFESVHVRKDGTSIPVEVSSRSVFIEGREMLLSVVRDITERKKRDIELQMLNRTLKAQSLSDQAMMRAKNETDYMNEVCSIIVKACGHSMVWIGFAEDDDYKSVRPVASAGFEQGYLESLNISWADNEFGRGPTGTAIRTGKTGMCRNMLTDPFFKPWREQAIRRGYASSIVFPLMTDGKAFGAISIYSREPDPFTEDEVQLLSELADDLAYGITAIRLRAALHRSEQNANAILNAITESIWLVAPDGRILAANSVAAESAGLRLSELGGKNYFSLLSPHLSKPRKIQAEKVFRSGNPVRFEDEKSGINYDHSIYPVRNEKGDITGLAIFSSDITSRKWAENRLAHQRAMLEAIIESSDGPVFSVDRNYCYTNFNSQHRMAMKSLFGADIKTGCRILDYYTNQEDIIFVKTNIDRAFHGDHVSLEVYLGNDEANRRYYGISSNPIREPGGTITGVAVFARDLTERKHMEDALRISEERYRTLFNSMTEGFALHEIICDENGTPCDCRFLDINPAFERLTGLKRENVLYRTQKEVLPGNDPYWIEAYGKVALTGNPIKMENYSSSLKRYYEVYAFRPAQHQFAVIFMDTTDRKLAEEKLEEAKRLLDALMEYVPMGITIADAPDGKIRMVSQHGQKMLGAQHDGMTLEEVTTQWKVFRKDGVTPMPDKDLPLSRAISRGETVKNRELVQINNKGQALPLLCNAAPIRTANGEITGGIVAWNDITERIEAEKILKRDKKTLQKLVKERSAELIEIQTELERSKRLSDIGTLAATVAHELRNPLAGINVAMAVIKRKNSDTTIEQQLHRIDHMVAESIQIIDNLLFYSRLRQPHRKTMDVHSLLAECIDTVKHVHIRKNILISKHLDSLQGLPVSADPVQIREVFINILNNATDAVPDHGGEIEVRARIYNELVKINITDNGQGIPKENLKKVFDPFFTTKPKGTGLGLTVCRQIVKMHGGLISVKCGKGRGTSVIITLPIKEPRKK